MMIYLLWGFLLLVFLSINSLIRPPRNFPKNIPVIPFYVSFITLFKKVDQEYIYHTYLKEPLNKYGAVAIYFGSRWNILLQRPEYLSELFKEISIYEKSGNQKKVPYSVLAAYTGDNIISAHGETWKSYRKVMQPGLQKQFDEEVLVRNAKIFVSLIKEQAEADFRNDSCIPVQQLIQRFTLANVSEELFGTNLETLSRPDAPLHTQQLAVKKEIFKPLYLNFAMLDRLPIPSRVAARKAVHEFAANLVNKIGLSNTKNITDKITVGSALVAARDSGVLTEQQFRDNAVIVFVAGHENPQLLITSLLYLLAKYQSFQADIRAELMNRPSEMPLKELPLLNSFIYEALRMFPPLSQIINRKTSRDVVLGGNICIPKDTYVGYTAYGAGRDIQTWGVDADEFRPERWGVLSEDIGRKYRMVKSKAQMIAFHGGSRACLGERFALGEIRIVIAQILTSLKWSLDPTWDEMMTPAGPLCPLMLRLRFESLHREIP